MVVFPRKILVTVWRKHRKTEIWEKCKLLYECGNRAFTINLDEINDERTHIENIDFIY